MTDTATLVLLGLVLLTAFSLVCVDDDRSLDGKS
jgi:hypothetical protein